MSPHQQITIQEDTEDTDRGRWRDEVIANPQVRSLELKLTGCDGCEPNDFRLGGI